MTPERWQQVKGIAGEALDLAPADRAAFVATACAADEELRAEVLSLLEADDPSGRFLEVDLPPERVGAWRIVREIGRGGMGTVYLAERADGQFEQRVAVKIVTRGRDSAAVVRRFHSERRILARLEHPNIARLFDGGVTADGRPYFVMEYLEAKPFLAYCRDEAIPLPRRVEMFVTLCEAVEHAHRHLILHRDIKAENVLVDERGAPKLLDCGIARLLDADAQGASPTEIGQRLLTPQCGSPEQMRGELLTTASDIYALGLLLYEALADRPAYELRGLTLAEQTLIVCEHQPQRPSEVAPAAVARTLRGDLDNIVLKAIEKEPARRYASAADLADDLHRFLAGRPVAARPAGVAYRAQKYAARHWRGLAVAGVAAAIVTVAVGDAIVQGRRAERRFNDVRALATSFMFEFHDAIAKLPGATPARELLVTRALQYLDSLAREAQGDVELTRELAQSYQRVGDVQGLYFESNLGQLAEARASYQRAVRLFSEVARRRPSDPGAIAELAQARLRLASTYQASDPQRARTLIEQALRAFPAESASAASDARVRMALATAYTGLAENTLSTPQQSLDARNHALDLFRALADANPQDEEAARWLSISLKRRAALRIGRLKDPASAAADLAAAAKTDEARIARDPANAVARLDLALGESYRAAALSQTGDLAGAAGALEHAVTLRKQVVEADPRNVRALTLLLGDYAKLAAILTRLGRADAARAVLQEGRALANHIDPSVPVTPELAAAQAELRAKGEPTHR